MNNPRALLRKMFEKAIEVAQPALCVPQHLPNPPKGKTYVVGAGKASAAMAQAVDGAWSGQISGLVIVRHGANVSCDRIKVIGAAHPVPDAAGVMGTQKIMEIASKCTPDDLLLVLISGGGSALLTYPADGLTLEDKRAVNQALLASGAPIDAMNCIRKHLSKVKGGRLAAAANGAHICTLAISDVVGNDPAVIASGPTSPDPTTYTDAQAYIEKYGIVLPAPAVDCLQAARDETPKPGDRAFDSAETQIIAAPAASLDAAKLVAEQAGYSVISLGDSVEGEARVVGQTHAKIALQSDPGSIILSGGELTVTLDQNGRGGPNAEYALSLATALNNERAIFALAADTDGIDGSEENAGVLVDPDTLRRAEKFSLDPTLHLEAHNSYEFFAALGDLVVTGPTQTNVNDFRAILIAR